MSEGEPCVPPCGEVLELSKGSATWPAGTITHFVSDMNLAYKNQSIVLADASLRAVILAARGDSVRLRVCEPCFPMYRNFSITWTMLGAVVHARFEARPDGREELILVVIIAAQVPRRLRLCSTSWLKLLPDESILQ